MIETTQGYDKLVFINCPFDKEYRPILRAIVFTLYRCGFYPATSLSEEDGSEFRLEKIMRFIEHCKFGIHDISRTEINVHGLPRFNMPFELGLFFGAKRFGINEQKNKNALVLERNKYSYMESISDLNGIDTQAHDNDPKTVIRKVRNWLSTASKQSEVPGYRLIEKEFTKFQKELAKITRKAGVDIDDMSFRDFCKIVEEWIENFIKATSLSKSLML